MQILGAKQGDKYDKYETALYFSYLTKNLTWDCLLISVFLPEFI